MGFAPDDLTPRERMVQSEGLAMLSQLAAKQAETKTGILGPDGQPVENTTEQKVEQPTQAPSPEDQLAAMRREREETFNKNTQELERLFDEYPKAKEYADGILHAYRLAHWLAAEMMTYEGFTQPVMTDLVKRIHAVAMNQQFSAADVISKIQHDTLPIMKERMRFYKAEQGKRQIKLSALKKRVGPHGITLPAGCMRKAIGGPYFHGVMALRGPYAAVRQTLKMCSHNHTHSDEGRTYYLTAQPEETKQKWATITMPANFWKDHGGTYSRLEDLLNPVVNDEAMLVLIEDIELLWADHGETPPLQVKAQVLANLCQWAAETMTAVIIGDVTASDDRLYSQLPNIKVSMETGLDDTERLSIGGEIVSNSQYKE